MTDEMYTYKYITQVGGRQPRSGQSRKDEYVRYEASTSPTNTVEGFYSIFKRGMKGVYQHCSEKDLHRYLCAFDFRYSQPRRAWH